MTEPAEDKPIAPAAAAPARLISLDAFRGFTMLAMVSDGLYLSRVASHFKGSRLWQFLDYETSHVRWGGCAAWDMIQPSFTFIAGVAMTYSIASRRSRGDSEARLWGHILWRAMILTWLGVFLRSNGRQHTYYTFEDVTSQIGLGYAFIYPFVGKGWRAQVAGLASILVGYWLLFALWPVTQPGFDATAAGIPSDWNKFVGFAAHWNKHVNPAGAFDRWFLNLFARGMEPDGAGGMRAIVFKANGGGYQTLSFIPSAATILIGVMAGEMLRGPLPLGEKVKRLALAGAACLAFGMALDGMIWPAHVESALTWSICPIVKRIWTPSWTIFAAGWTFLILSAFVWVIDVRGWKKWSFPLLVVGMNSIAIYVMKELVGGWIEQTLRTHLGQKFFDATDANPYMPILGSASMTFALWLACFWMYRRKLFIRI